MGRSSGVYPIKLELNFSNSPWLCWIPSALGLWVLDTWFSCLFWDKKPGINRLRPHSSLGRLQPPCRTFWHLRSPLWLGQKEKISHFARELNHFGSWRGSLGVIRGFLFGAASLVGMAFGQMFVPPAPKSSSQGMSPAPSVLCPINKSSFPQKSFQLFSKESRAVIFSSLNKPSLGVPLLSPVFFSIYLSRGCLLDLLRIRHLFGEAWPCGTPHLPLGEDLGPAAPSGPSTLSPAPCTWCLSNNSLSVLLNSPPRARPPLGHHIDRDRAVVLNSCKVNKTLGKRGGL